MAILALIAFAIGAAITVGARVLVAAFVLKPSGLDIFAGNLVTYTRPVDSTSFVPGFLRPFERLLRDGEVLVYGSNTGVRSLYASVAVAWSISLGLAYRSATHTAWADLSAFVIGAGGILAWTIALQTHTWQHADFMARILIVPISLGWSAMLWQLLLKHGRGSRQAQYA
jgi:hypothetical protein